MNKFTASVVFEFLTLSVFLISFVFFCQTNSYILLRIIALYVLFSLFGSDRCSFVYFYFLLFHWLPAPTFSSFSKKQTLLGSVKHKFLCPGYRTERKIFRQRSSVPLSFQLVCVHAGHLHSKRHFVRN